MTPIRKIRIETFVPDADQLKEYAMAFREACPRWINYLGDHIYFTHEGFDEGAEELWEALEKARPSRLVPLLKKYEALPEKLYRFTDAATGASETAPLYTEVKQVSLEGRGAILAEAFHGGEVHLLDPAGRFISRFHHEYVPRFGLGQTYIIDCNSLYDSQVKGRRDDDANVEILGYAPGFVDRSFNFMTKKGTDYIVRLAWGDDGETRVKGTGNPMTLELPKNLGSYVLFEILKSDEFGNARQSQSISKYHVGLHWKDIRDFTIQYNTFPFIDDRDKWVKQAGDCDPEKIYQRIREQSSNREFLEKQCSHDPCSFQFMPEAIRSDKEWVERFCLEEPVNFLFASESLRNDPDFICALIRKPESYYPTIYAYLPEHLRKNLEVLKVMKECKRLFDLPDPEKTGYVKYEDIRTFVLNYRSRIHEVLDLFPNALRYAPFDMLNDREIVLKALSGDKELVAMLNPFFLDDPEIIAAASDKWFPSLKYASDRLKRDPLFIMMMLERCGENINHIPQGLRSDRKFVLAAAHAGSRILEYVPDHFRNDEEVMLKIISDSGFALEKASDRLRRDKAFNLKALQLGTYYTAVHPTLREDRDIVLKAMQVHPHEFERIPDRYKADREIVKTVVSTPGGYGKYIKLCPDEFKNDPELMRCSVADNPWNINLAGERLLGDRNFLEQIIHDHPQCFRHLPDGIKSDQTLATLAEKRKAELSANKPAEIPKPEKNKDDLPF